MIVTCPKCGAKNRVSEVTARTHQPVCGRCGTKLPIGTGGGTHTVEVTDSNFTDMLASAGDRPVLIDFWADWCPPCKMLAPAIDQLAAEAAGRYVIGKLDTDANPVTAGRFDITSIPTLLIFRKGELVDRLVGLMPKDAIAAKLAQFA